LDKNDALVQFATNIEKATIDTVESGKMTKDLAILVEGKSVPPRDTWLNTFEFIDAVAADLELKMKA